MKPCPLCAESIQDSAIKCRFCGSMLDGSDNAQRAGTVAASGPAGSSVTIFSGTPSWKAQLWSFVGAAALAIAGVVGLFVLRLSFDLPWVTAVIAGACAFGLAVLWLVYLTALRVTLRFRITTRTIDVESGLLSKSIETLQLWKVRDIEFHQTLTDRILNVSRIRVFSHDVTTPQFLLWGLPGSRAIFDRLKDAMELARQGRNVIGVVD
ncbi:MAG TPA: PH domain-containing protein [Polyangia bacterium]|jgi:hypothetical protein|nr:PH domain-containing protein [Polyangia bacterium]